MGLFARIQSVITKTETRVTRIVEPVIQRTKERAVKTWKRICDTAREVLTFAKCLVKVALEEFAPEIAKIKGLFSVRPTEG